MSALRTFLIVLVSALVTLLIPSSSDLKVSGSESRTGG
jgi:hypothetical protein